MSDEATALLHAGRLRAAREAFARQGDDLWRRSLDTYFELLEGTWRPPPIEPPGEAAVPGRVAHLVGESLPLQNGYTLRTQHVAEAQRAAGLDPHVLTRRDDAGPDEDRTGGIPYRGLGGRGALHEQLAGQLATAAQRLRELRAAVVHPASDFVNARLALWLGEAFRIPVVYEARGLWEESWFTDAEPRDEAVELDKLRRDAEVQCMCAADAVVTLSETMRAELVAARVPADRIHVVPNGVDPQAFPPRRGAGAGAAPVLGYVGSITPYEGLECLLEAAALLRDRGSPVRTLIVGGGGKELDRLRERARGLGLDVGFPGCVPHSEIARWYGQIDVFAIPRRDEPVCRRVAPVKPFEAMAAGCAVIVSDLPALREAVRPGHAGVAVPPEDAGALADAVETLARDPARRQALGARARRWVLTERTWAAAGERYRELYAALGAA